MQDAAARVGNQINKFELAAPSLLAGLRLRLAVRAIGMEEARFRVVREGQPEQFIDNAVARRPILNRKSEFDPAEEIARHPIRRAEIDLRACAVLKIKNPAVFEKPVHDAAHRDV